MCCCASNSFARQLQQVISDTNFVYELDKTTQEIIAAILQAQTHAVLGDCVPVPKAEQKISLTTVISPLPPPPPPPHTRAHTISHRSYVSFGMLLLQLFLSLLVVVASLTRNTFGS
jgi:hypothetical protein